MTPLSGSEEVLKVRFTGSSPHLEGAAGGIREERDEWGAVPALGRDQLRDVQRMGIEKRRGSRSVSDRA